MGMIEAGRGWASSASERSTEFDAFRRPSSTLVHLQRFGQKQGEELPSATRALAVPSALRRTRNPPWSGCFAKPDLFPCELSLSVLSFQKLDELNTDTNPAPLRWLYAHSTVQSRPTDLALLVSSSSSEVLR